MHLTFDYKDIKEVLETMNITIHDVYFSSHATCDKVISTFMYWIAPADAFNYYQDPTGIVSVLYIQVKGKWFGLEDIYDYDDDLLASEIVDWLKTQKHVNLRYFIDGSGSGTIGALDQNCLG